MRYLAPFVIHSSLSISQPADAAPHALAWRAAVEALVGETIDHDAAARAERLNDVLIPAAGVPGA
jgi:hypothetical protein